MTVEPIITIVDALALMCFGVPVVFWFAFAASIGWSIGKGWGVK